MRIFIIFFFALILVNRLKSKADHAIACEAMPLAVTLTTLAIVTLRAPTTEVYPSILEAWIKQHYVARTKSHVAIDLRYL